MTDKLVEYMLELNQNPDALEISIIRTQKAQQ